MDGCWMDGKTEVLFVVNASLALHVSPSAVITPFLRDHEVDLNLDPGGAFEFPCLDHV